MSRIVTASEVDRLHAQFAELTRRITAVEQFVEFLRSDLQTELTSNTQQGSPAVEPQTAENNPPYADPGVSA